MWPCQNKRLICGTDLRNHLPLVTGPTFSFLPNLAISYPKAIHNILISMWPGYYLLIWPWGVGKMSIRGKKIHEGLFSYTEATAQHNWCLPETLHSSKYFGGLQSPCWPCWVVRAYGHTDGQSGALTCELVGIDAACDIHPSRQTQKILVNAHH